MGGVARSRLAALGITEPQKGGQDKKQPPENPHSQHRRSELIAGEKPSITGERDCAGGGWSGQSRRDVESDKPSACQRSHSAGSQHKTVALNIVWEEGKEMTGTGYCNTSQKQRQEGRGWDQVVS